ncbi:MAG TPA: alkaline phosphatase family protein [Terracidiphilus sp.]|nr:alkaline phosphatase family protein [Terracidiphilus sp.]
MANRRSRTAKWLRAIDGRRLCIGVSLAIIATASLWVCAGVIGCGGSIRSLPASPPVPVSTVSPIPGSPIQHIVIIMQENRSFDNLFNGYPGADTVQGGMNGDELVPLKAVSLSDSRDLKHSHMRWLKDWDNGRMDGFEENGSLLPYSYVPRSDVEEYWTLAQQYVLGDRMFQANTGPSFVAHQYMIAGQSGNVAENPTGSVWGCDAAPGTTAALIGPNGTELPGIFPCFDYQTTADLLDEKGVTWRYYAPGAGDSFYVLSAYQAIRHIRFGKDWNENVISPSRRVLVDINHGELAQVTWIIPDYAHSDHPGSGGEGPAWIASIVNAIGNSHYWNSTAIFISWDDWGGWYDHVSPTKVDEMGPGFRVPLLVVSPYAKHGYISHHFHEASGFIKFIEHNFDLGTLGARDAGSEAFSDCFDYTQKPPAFNAIPSKVSAAHIMDEVDSGPPDDD